MPVVSNRLVNNAVDFLSTGKDVDVYLCDILLNDMVLGINVSEGGVPEKITSFNSSIVQHYALPPIITELQIMYYHTPENVDKMHRILIDQYFKIMKAFHSVTKTSYDENSFKFLMSILGKALKLGASKYSSNKTINQKSICENFSRVINDAYNKDIKTLNIHLSRTFLSDDNYEFKSKPNTYVDIALNNVTSEFYGFMIKYYNLFIVNIARYFRDDIVTDEDIKYLFMTSIFNNLSITITTNKSKKLVASEDEEYKEYEDVADFKKYIGIMPYGPFVYQIQNVGDSIVSSKTMYSIGRFDDIFIPRNDGVPQNLDQLKIMVNPIPMTFDEFVNVSEKKATIITKNIYELMDFMQYAWKETYPGNVTTAKKKEFNNIVFKQVSLTGLDPRSLRSISGQYNGISLKRLMDSYKTKKQIATHNLLNVCYDTTGSGIKTLKELMNTHPITSSEIVNRKNVLLPGDKTIILAADSSLEHKTENKHPVYFLIYKNNSVIYKSIDCTYNSTALKDDSQTPVTLPDPSEIVLKFTIDETEYVYTITLEFIPETNEDGTIKDSYTMNLTRTQEPEYKGTLPIQTIKLKFTDTKDDTEKVLSMVTGTYTGIKSIKVVYEPGPFKKKIDKKISKTSDELLSLLHFFGVPSELEIPEVDIKDITQTLTKIKKESIIYTISKKDGNNTLETISIYDGNKDR